MKSMMSCPLCEVRKVWRVEEGARAVCPPEEQICRSVAVSLPSFCLSDKHPRVLVHPHTLILSRTFTTHCTCRSYIFRCTDMPPLICSSLATHASSHISFGRPLSFPPSRPLAAACLRATKKQRRAFCSAWPFHLQISATLLGVWGETTVDLFSVSRHIHMFHVGFPLVNFPSSSLIYHRHTKLTVNQQIKCIQSSTISTERSLQYLQLP